MSSVDVAAEIRRLRGRIQDLVRENAALDEELTRLRSAKWALALQGEVVAGVGRLGVLMWLGPSLSRAAKDWAEAVSLRSTSIPHPETAYLISAILRRLIRIGLIAAVIGIFPSALLVWQNLLIRSQNSYFREQIAEMQQQSRGDQVTRHLQMLLEGGRAQFWAAVSYFSSREDLQREALDRLGRMLLESEGEGACAALEALARLAPETGIGPDGMILRNVRGVLLPLLEHRRVPYGGIPIRNLICKGKLFYRVDLSDLSLENAHLQSARFSYVNLAGSSFSNTSLIAAEFLDGISWMKAEGLSGTNFSGSDLRGSVFEGEVGDIILDNAELSGAMFTWASGEELRRLPSRYLKGGVCLRPEAARACHEWHRSRLLQVPAGEPPPDCPNALERPIIRVLGPESDVGACEEMVSEKAVLSDN